MAKPHVVKKINLALQGGGAQGAYTWGVLDCLLEDTRVEFDGISGTSAGAMNAVVLADGFTKDGRDGARKALDTFWYNVSKLGAWSPLPHAPLQKLFNLWNMDWSPSFTFFDVMTRIFSPYQTNPMNINPLKDVLLQSVDFERLRASDHLELFVTATSVTTGQPRVFGRSEVTVDAVMASACLPFWFQAVEIDGDCYWDGGYMGNPSIWPLIYYCESRDIVIVEINPIIREGVPKDGKDIINRLNEISFNSSLIAEMRAINFVNKLIDHDHLKDSDDYQRTYVHVIESSKEMLKMNASSKLNVSWEYFCYLHNLGRDAASVWLDKHFNAVGEKSTVNINEAFLGHVRRPKAKRKEKAA